MEGISGPTDPGPAPSSFQGPPAGMPPWLWGALTIVGVVLGGSGAGFLGGTQAAEKMDALEDKVEQLDEKIDLLREAVIRAHPGVP